MFRTYLLVLFACLTTVFSAKAVGPSLAFKQSVGNPSTEPEYALGVSACFAGKLQGKLLMAGGCNFPTVPAAEGGKKKYYRAVYAADLGSSENLKWNKVGELPVPMAYGATIQVGDHLILIGGMNDQGNLATVYNLTLNSNQVLVIEQLPSLPQPMDNLAGALLGRRLYVAGGKVNGKPSNQLQFLDLEQLNRGWQTVASFPGPPRVQPVLAAQEGAIYLWGGFSAAFDGHEPTLSTDGYSYNCTSNSWTNISAPKDSKGKDVSLGGGVAIALQDSFILCAGGVNKDVFRTALQREAKLKGPKAKQASAAYLAHPAAWYRFNKQVFVYNTRQHTWQVVGENESMARAGAALVADNNLLFMIQGERKPGIRTPEITRLDLTWPNDFAAAVNPFIGTGGHGHTFPGPTMPFGMIQPGPDTRINGWDACSGYYYADSTINGFSHSHLSGTGCGDYGDLLIMPTVGKQDIRPVSTQTQTLSFASPFSHQNEQASPGYYSVYLDRYGVKAELTATKRAALHRYTFPASNASGFVFDVDYSLQNQRNNKLHLEIVGDTAIKGYKNTSGWAWDHQVCFYAVFSKPFTYTFVDDTIQTDVLQQRFPRKKVLLHFETVENEQVLVKMALSSVDVDGAERNLRSELPGWDFEATLTEARQAWNEYLGKIKISTTDNTQKTIFYTALYHTGITPNLLSDVDGRYRGMNKKTMLAAPDKPVYTVFSLWDTFRAFHPLMTIIDPTRNSDFIHSMLLKYKEGGILPMWELASNYTGTMIGYNAVPVIVDAYVKGDRSFNATEALKACMRSAEYDTTGILSTRYVRDNGLMPRSKYFKNTLGYIPCDQENENVAKGLEYAYDDWCIAQLAQGLNAASVANRYEALSKNYKQYFDPSVGFMRGKDSNGHWRVPFAPNTSTHREDDYCEGTAWQWTWFVPHDVEGLKKMLGGEKAFVTKLDSLFSVNTPMAGDKISADISGLIGQYAHGNEPSHHITHLYNYAHQPWKTQALVDSVLYHQYRNAPDGLSGNEDCGQMSAWYVLNAMGFYQVCPGNPTYSIGRPLFDRVVIPLSNGKQFEVVVKHASRTNKYVRSVKLNKRLLKTPFFTHQDILNGGILEIEMSNKPTL